MTQDTLALVRHDLRVWMKRQPNPLTIAVAEIVVTGLRNLENDPGNTVLRQML